MLERVQRKGNQEPSYTVTGSVSWCSHYGEALWSFIKKLKVELPLTQQSYPGHVGIIILSEVT